MKCFLVWIVVFLQTLSIYAQTPIEAFLNQKPGADAVNTMAKAYLHLGLYEDAEELLHKAYIKAGHLYDPNISYYTISAEAKLLAAFLCEDSAIDDRDQLLLKRLQRLQDGVTIAKEGQDFLEKNREGVSADAYTRHRTSILLVLGRLYMSTGDEAYRTSKPSIAAASTIQANPSAMLEYRRAAQAFYEARMISDNQEALFLATQLGNRRNGSKKDAFLEACAFLKWIPFWRERIGW